MVDSVLKDEYMLYPILASELEDEIDNVEYFPIWASEIIVDMPKKVKEDKKEEVIQKEIKTEEVKETKKQYIGMEFYESSVKTEPVVNNQTQKEIVSTPIKEVSVIEVLKENGKYPTVKDEEKNTVIDEEYINKAIEAVPAGEYVLHALYGWVAYCSKDKVKAKKKEMLKVPFLENTLKILLVTDKSLIVVEKNTRFSGPKIISKTLIESVNHIMNKKLTNLGQTQIMLNDGNIVVITIDRTYDNTPEQKQFDDFTGMMDTVLGFTEKESNATRTEAVSLSIYKLKSEGERIAQQRRKLYEVLDAILLKHNIYVNNNITDEERYVALVLSKYADKQIKIYYDNVTSSSVCLLLMSLKCYDEKINEILKDGFIKDISNIDRYILDYLKVMPINNVIDIQNNMYEYVANATEDARESYKQLISQR